MARLLFDPIFARFIDDPSQAAQFYVGTFEMPSAVAGGEDLPANRLLLMAAMKDNDADQLLCRNIAASAARGERRSRQERHD
jgi:hypothetical protein